MKPSINYKVTYTALVNGHIVNRSQIIAAPSANRAKYRVGEWLFRQGILHVIRGAHNGL